MIKQKIYDARIQKVVSCIAAFAMVSVLTLLVMEYYALNKTAQQVLELKEDYRSYVMALKHALREKNRESLKDEKTDVKKKTIVDETEGQLASLSGFSNVVDSEFPQENFLVVNREPRHLRANALEHAKKYNLDQALAQMFDTQDWQKAQQGKKVIRLQIKKKKRQKKMITGTAQKPAVFHEEVIAKGDGDFLFSWPIERSKFWLSSRFGPRKIGKRAWKFHYGIDMAAPRGTPVQAAAGGIVIQSQLHPGYGNCIMVMHNRKYSTRYAHLHARHVKVGEKVERGEVIGVVGATGHVVSKKGRVASHLHFEVTSFGRHVNPVSVLI